VSKGEATRQTILDHAVREAAQVGLRGLTIGGLAGGLGLSKSGLFAHFNSKQELDAEVIDRAAQHFIERVVRPALRAPRGEPRVRALMEEWLNWPDQDGPGRGCIFVAAAAELDDQPGAARDRLVAQQRDWLDLIASVARVAIAEGHFRADLDTEQLAVEFLGVMLAYHHASRLLGDPRAGERARRSCARLLADARVLPAPARLRSATTRPRR
jgi:AcrR family transcriptional regulator